MDYSTRGRGTRGRGGSLWMDWCDSRRMPPVLPSQTVTCKCGHAGFSTTGNSQISCLNEVQRSTLSRKSITSATTRNQSAAARTHEYAYVFNPTTWYVFWEIFAIVYRSPEAVDSEKPGKVIRRFVRELSSDLKAWQALINCEPTSTYT